MKTGLPSAKNVLTQLTKSVLIPLGLTMAASAVDAATFLKKALVSGTASLIISNEEMDDIRKIVKSLEDSILLIKGNSEMNQKNKGVGFLIYCW